MWHFWLSCWKEQVKYEAGGHRTFQAELNLNPQNDDTRSRTTRARTISRWISSLAASNSQVVVNEEWFDRSDEDVRHEGRIATEHELQKSEHMRQVWNGWSHHGHDDRVVEGWLHTTRCSHLQQDSSQVPENQNDRKEMFEWWLLHFDHTTSMLDKHRTTCRRMIPTPEA